MSRNDQENASRKSKIGICTSYDVSGCSLKKYTQNFNKGMQNLGESTFNNNAANRSKEKQKCGVDGTTVDKTGVDKTLVDETGVDKLGCYHLKLHHFVYSQLPVVHHKLSQSLLE